MTHQPSERKKLHIQTWGCQMNVYDSRRMSDVLKPLGYDVTDTPVDADMVILNTCHIREKATDKVFSELGRLREQKEKKSKTGTKMILAVAGCVAQAEGEFILDRAPYVDMVFGPQNYHQLPEMVNDILGNAARKRVVNTDFPVEDKFDLLPDSNSTQGPAAFLSIQEGCDKFCTFCVVPYTRGAEYSRSVQSVLDEAKRLVDAGARDITLLGQNVNAFHGTAHDGSTWGLGRLLQALSEINGLDQLRYMTSHPRDCDDELIQAHASLPKLMPFLHLPIQSGSDKILKAMNRKHDAAFYLDLIEKFRKARPDMAFSSDFIVGFPGETEEDLQATMDVARAVRYASAYSFKYSARPGTPAAVMQNLVPEAVKDERLQRLQALLISHQTDFNRSFIGQTMTVLFDNKGREPGQLYGRTAYNQAIHVTAPERLLGSIEHVTITHATQSSLTGTLVLQDPTRSGSP